MPKEIDRHAGGVRAGLAALAVLVLLTGWAWTRRGGAPPQSGPLTFSAARVGDVLPSLTLTGMDGTTLSVPAGRPTVLFFMAGWCASCLPEGAALARLHDEFGARVLIAAIDVDPDDPPASLAAFARRAGNARYLFAHDQDGQLAGALSVHALDTTIVANGQGRIVYRDAVPTTEAGLRAALARAGLR